MNPSEIAERAAREKILVERSLLEGLLSFMQQRFDRDRLLQHQIHFIREIERAIEESRGQPPMMGCESCGKPPTEHFCSREVNFEYYTEPKKEVMPVERAGQKSLSQVRNSDIAGDASAKTRAGEPSSAPPAKAVKIRTRTR